MVTLSIDVHSARDHGCTFGDKATSHFRNRLTCKTSFVPTCLQDKLIVLYRSLDDDDIEKESRFDQTDPIFRMFDVNGRSFFRGIPAQDDGKSAA